MDDNHFTIFAGQQRRPRKDFQWIHFLPGCSYFPKQILKWQLSSNWKTEANSPHLGEEMVILLIAWAGVEAPSLRKETEIAWRSWKGHLGGGRYAYNVEGARDHCHKYQLKYYSGSWDSQTIWQPCGVFQMDLHGPPACVILDHICNTAPKAWRLQMKLKVTPGCLGPMLKSCDICGSLEWAGFHHRFHHLYLPASSQQ